MIKVINCKHVLSGCSIEEIKSDIKNYHQGFMIINDELYIPYHTALRLGLEFKEEDVTVLDSYDNVTARDIVAHEFGRTDVNELDIIDLAEAVYNHDLFQVVVIVADITEHAYNKGFDDGYEC